jgi:hypothetical protein
LGPLPGASGQLPPPYECLCSRRTCRSGLGRPAVLSFGSASSDLGMEPAFTIAGNLQVLKPTRGGQKTHGCRSHCDSLCVWDCSLPN